MDAELSNRSQRFWPPHSTGRKPNQKLQTHYGEWHTVCDGHRGNTVPSTTRTATGPASWSHPQPAPPWRTNRPTKRRTPRWSTQPSLTSSTASNNAHVGTIHGCGNALQGSFVDFGVENPTAGNYNMAVRYANGGPGTSTQGLAYNGSALSLWTTPQQAARDPFLTPSIHPSTSRQDQHHSLTGAPNHRVRRNRLHHAHQMTKS
jgi:hypothetical protein